MGVSCWFHGIGFLSGVADGIAPQAAASSAASPSVPSPAPPAPSASALRSPGPGRHPRPPRHRPAAEDLPAHPGRKRLTSANRPPRYTPSIQEQAHSRTSDTRFADQHATQLRNPGSRHPGTWPGAGRGCRCTPNTRICMPRTGSALAAVAPVLRPSCCRTGPRPRLMNPIAGHGAGGERRGRRDAVGVPGRFSGPAPDAGTSPRTARSRERHGRRPLWFSSPRRGRRLCPERPRPVWRHAG